MLTLVGPEHFARISKRMMRQTLNVLLRAFVCLKAGYVMV